MPDPWNLCMFPAFLAYISEPDFGKKRCKSCSLGASLCSPQAQDATCLSPTLYDVAGAGGGAWLACATGCLAEPSRLFVPQTWLRRRLCSPCRTSTAHSSVQVPEERQSDVLWPEDHEEGNLCCRPASYRPQCSGAPSSLWLPSLCSAVASVPSET